MQNQLIMLFTAACISSPLFAWEGKVFHVDGKKITIASTDTAALKTGAKVYIMKEGAIVGQGKAGTAFHTKVEITLLSGLAQKGLYATDIAPKIQHKAKPIPAPIYVDNGDGTVLEKITKLVWKKCSEGQNNDATCTGEARTFQFCPAADNSCNGGESGKPLTSGPIFDACNALNQIPGGFAGRTSWRVPVHSELLTLVRCHNKKDWPYDGAKRCDESLVQIDQDFQATIDSKFFPNTRPWTYWSSTTQRYSVDWMASVVYFWGSSASDQKGSANHLRCVASQ